MRRCIRLAPASTKLLAYKTFIRPILEYAHTVWFPQTTTNIAKLEKIQRKALRFIHNKYKRTDSPSNLAAISGLPTLSMRAKHARLKFLYQLLHNDYNINVSKYICPSQTRPTRHKHALTLTDYSYRTDALKHSFFPVAIREWNKLDASITHAPTLTTFATRLEAGIAAE